MGATRFELEPPIRALDATNRGDFAAFRDAFADDAVIDDWGRTFTGRAEIAGRATKTARSGRRDRRLVGR